MQKAREQAIDKPVSLLLLSQLVGGVIAGPCHTFLPAYLSDLGTSAALISAIFTSQRVTGLISSLVGGALSDYLSPKQTLLIGQIGLICAALTFSSPSITIIVLLWAAYGFGTGLHTLGGQSYLIENANHKRLGMLTALYYWGYTVGGAIGGPVAAFIIGDFRYSRYSLSFAGISVVGLLITATLLPSLSSKTHRRRDSPGKAERPGARLFGYGHIAKKSSARLLAALRFLPTFCYGMMTIFVPLVLRTNGATVAVLAAYVTVSSVSAALSQFVVGRLADGASPKWPTILCYLTFGVSALCVTLFLFTVWGVFISGVLGISSAWSLSVLMAPLVTRSTKPAERGRTLGFMHLFWNLGMILGSLVGGVLFETWMGLPFAVGGIAVIVCPFLVVLFFRHPPISAD